MRVLADLTPSVEFKGLCNSLVWNRVWAWLRKALEPISARSSCSALRRGKQPPLPLALQTAQEPEGYKQWGEGKGEVAGPSVIEDLAWPWLDCARSSSAFNACLLDIPGTSLSSPILQMKKLRLREVSFLHQSTCGASEGAVSQTQVLSELNSCWTRAADGHRFSVGVRKMARDSIVVMAEERGECTQCH